MALQADGRAGDQRVWVRIVSGWVHYHATITAAITVTQLSASRHVTVTGLPRSEVTSQLPSLP
jgi:hypothetical protein